MSVNPLVTVMQLSFNNEKYIAESLEAALSQTYHPLQIIVSDDCSQDRSFAIIQDIVAAYDGPHQVIVRRNERNLGLGDNVNQVMEIAEGELIVESDGDDISSPDRVAETVELWRQSGKKYLVMSGASVMIDESGKAVQGEALPRIRPMSYDRVLHSSGIHWVYGGSLAWHRSVFELFGPLRRGVVAQDKAIGFRILLLGREIGYVEQPVIKYRFHSANLTNDRTGEERLRHKITMFGSFVQDFETARSLGLLAEQENSERVYQEFIATYENFSLREKVLTSSLLRSVWILITCGSKLSAAHKKSLFIKRISGRGV